MNSFRGLTKLIGVSDRRILLNTVRQSSLWSHVEQGPPDAIFGIVEACNKDPNPDKINLSFGVYRDDNGESYVLPAIQKAEKIIVNKELDKEYAGIVGNPAFTKAAAKLALGPLGHLYDDGLVSTFQTISGTGALKLGALFLGKLYPHQKVIYLSNPSWPNHGPVFKNSGLEVGAYRYYDKESRQIILPWMLEDLDNLPNNSAVLLHACAHNPTGMDPSKEQWKEISDVIKRKGHFVFFDMAYQGFASGDLDRDAYAVRLFLERGHDICLAQSFAKNMGLYGERVGAFSVFCNSEETKTKVESQIKLIVRPNYSNPPIHGARIAVEILSNPELHSQWLVELKGMADRIKSMRTQLVDNLKKEGSTHDWSHIINQIGMFAYSGLNDQQVERITKEYSVYLTKDGRMSVTGMTSKNVGYLAKAMHDVTK